MIDMYFIAQNNNELDYEPINKNTVLIAKDAKGKLCTKKLLNDLTNFSNEIFDSDEEKIVINHHNINAKQVQTLLRVINQHKKYGCIFRKR